MRLDSVAELADPIDPGIGGRGSYSRVRRFTVAQRAALAVQVYNRRFPAVVPLLARENQDGSGLGQLVWSCLWCKLVLDAPEVAGVISSARGVGNQRSRELAAYKLGRLQSLGNRPRPVPRAFATISAASVWPEAFAMSSGVAPR